MPFLEKIPFSWRSQDYKGWDEMRLCLSSVQSAACRTTQSIPWENFKNGNR
jgi:hypothetical protein